MLDLYAIVQYDGSIAYENHCAKAVSFDGDRVGCIFCNNKNSYKLTGLGRHFRTCATFRALFDEITVTSWKELTFLTIGVEIRFLPTEYMGSFLKSVTMLR